MEPLYDLQAVRPMWEGLAKVGIEPLSTAQQVRLVLGDPAQGTVLLFINSVCGCSAGNARPGVSLALQHHVIPDRSVTVFAGVDREATGQARAYLGDLPPSSPFVALFKKGELIFVLQRYQIEMMTAQMIAAQLRDAFDAYCSAPGPSVPREVYAQAGQGVTCGSALSQRAMF